MAMECWRRCVENLDKMQFDGVGKYGIPEMQPVKWEDSVEFIPFNQARRCREPEKYGVHYFLKDYMFFRVWTNPDIYTPQMARFKCCCTPDFSLYTDFPFVVQLYNHYRKHWLGAYWQANGLMVIPTISWSDESSYDWCFDGDPVGGTVAVSSVGTQMSKESKRLFLIGYNEMLRRLEPETILFYGDVPAGCDGNIVELPAFQKRFDRMKPIA